MKNLVVCIFAIMLMSSFLGNAQTSQKEAQSPAFNKIEAYYFHFSTRCQTCRAVEAETKADIETLYAGKVSFKVINLDDASSKAIAEKLKISGQTLLIVKGNQKINLTNEGFMYATTDPAKLKSIIKQKVDGLLAL